MTRALLLLAIGVTLGLLMHLVIVLAIPRVSEKDGWSRAMAFAESEGVTVLPPARPGNEAIPLLDPKLAYAVCRFDLSGGPWQISAPLPRAFWSMALFTRDTGVFYAVTRDASPADVFEIEIRNADQTRRFRMEEVVPDGDVLQIEAPADHGLVLFRALAPGRSGRADTEARLAETVCAQLPERVDPDRPMPFPFPRPRPPDLS